ncbi:Protein pbn1, partial [Penicillium diatomitis]
PYYIRPNPRTPFAPDQISLSASTLSVQNLVAAREDRITLSLSELPDELRNVLEQSHELRLRWATERSFDAIAPFASRISPGLHVHYTPQARNGSQDSICTLLRTIFVDHEDGEAVVDCTRPEDSFITTPLVSTRFATSASLQYYTRLADLRSLVAYIRRTACHQEQSGGSACHKRADTLLTANSVDIDYDSISHAVTISGFWAQPPANGWTEEVSKSASDNDKVEIGVLTAEKGIERTEIQVGGLLAVVGEDKKMKPTMFSFPSRHHPLPSDATYSVSFSKPTGLHPTMSITMQAPSLQRPPAPEDATCALHTYLTLPSSVFGDQYQLGTKDTLFLESHNLAALRAHAGEMDLEAPDWAVQRWGSTWLFELDSPTVDEGASALKNWTATIPLHLRYLPPSDTGYRTAQVPWPVVFWACTAEDGTKMGVNPFDRTNLGWDGLFGPRTMFYQLHPETGRLVEEIEVPVLKLNNGEGLVTAQIIELGTSFVILLGFLWVLWRLIQVGFLKARPGFREGHEKKE